MAKVGRPSKYKPEFCHVLIDFFGAEPYEDREINHYKGKGDKREVHWTDYKRFPNKLPTLVEFARGINVGIRTVYDWIDEKHGSYQKEFSQTFIQAKKLQKNFLIQNGLQGLYNPIFAKFVAVNITDMADKQAVQIDGNVSSDVIEPDKAIALYERKIAELRRGQAAGTALAGEVESDV